VKSEKKKEIKDALKTPSESEGITNGNEEKGEKERKRGKGQDRGRRIGDREEVPRGKAEREAR